MAAANITFTFELKDSGDSSIGFELINVVYPLYALIWLLSIYLQYYEFKRGLPHAWQCHLMFWSLSFVSQSSLLVFVCLKYFNEPRDPQTDELTMW